MIENFLISRSIFTLPILIIYGILVYSLRYIRHKNRGSRKPMFMKEFFFAFSPLFLCSIVGIYAESGLVPMGFFFIFIADVLVNYHKKMQYSWAVAFYVIGNIFFGIEIVRHIQSISPYWITVIPWLVMGLYFLIKAKDKLHKYDLWFNEIYLYIILTGVLIITSFAHPMSLLACSMWYASYITDLNVATLTQRNFSFFRKLGVYEWSLYFWAVALT